MLNTTARLILVSVALLLQSTASAIEDPVSVSLKGVSIPHLPDFVILVTQEPQADWEKFTNEFGVEQIDDEQQRTAGVFSASRGNVLYQFLAPSATKTIFGAESMNDASGGTVIYVWKSVNPSTQQDWIGNHRLIPIQSYNQHRENGRLYTASKNYYVWFLDAEKCKVCPMHPHFFLGDSIRCQLCEMPKVPIGQIPD